MTKEEIIFEHECGYPEYYSYFDFQVEDFDYSACIIEPHDSINYYEGILMCALSNGGGYNILMDIKGESFNEVEELLINKIIKLLY